MRCVSFVQNHVFLEIVIDQQADSDCSHAKSPLALCREISVGVLAR